MIKTYRDDWGIPHLWASDALQLAFGQGENAALDRAWQIEVERHCSQGTTAAFLGADAVTWDRFARQVRLTAGSPSPAVGALVPGVRLPAQGRTPPAAVSAAALLFLGFALVPGIVVRNVVDNGLGAHGSSQTGTDRQPPRRTGPDPDGRAARGPARSSRAPRRKHRP
jgi:hypothetical protein